MQNYRLNHWKKLTTKKMNSARARWTSKIAAVATIDSFRFLLIYEPIRKTKIGRAEAKILPATG